MNAAVLDAALTALFLLGLFVVLKWCSGITGVGPLSRSRMLSLVVLTTAVVCAGLALAVILV